MLKPVLAVSIALNLGLLIYLVAGSRAQSQRIINESASELSRARPTSEREQAQPVSSELRPYAALGSFVAENNHLAALQWTEAQFAAFVQGIQATYRGRSVPSDPEADQLREQINTKVQAMLQAKRPDPIADYFRTLREKEGVLRTESGLHYRVTEEGTGERPTADATVVVSFSGRLPDGRALPMLVRTRVKTLVKDLLPGVAEGVQLLGAGGKALVYVPADLSFKNGPWPDGIPQGAPIILFLELHDVNPW